MKRETNKFLRVQHSVVEWRNAQVKIENFYAPKTEKVINSFLFLTAFGLFFCPNLILRWTAVVPIAWFAFLVFKPKVDETKTFRKISRKIWQKSIRKKVAAIQIEATDELSMLNDFIRAMIHIREWREMGEEAQQILLKDKRKNKEKEILTGYSKG